MFNTNAMQSPYTDVDQLTTYGYTTYQIYSGKLEDYQSQISPVYQPTSAGGLGLDKSTEQAYSYGLTGTWKGQGVG